MGARPLTSRTRLAALAISCVAAGSLLAQAAPAGATPAATPTPTGSSGTTASGTTASGTAGPRKPAATAPPLPTDYGPPCSTNATAPYPVVCLPTGSGEDRPATLTPGGDVEFAAQVVNNQATAVTDATVAITLPTGLTLESDEDDPVFRVDDWYKDSGAEIQEATDLTCRPAVAGTISCQVGALKAHANILVVLDLEVARDATPGRTLSFQVALQPVGPDVYPSTSVIASIDVLAPSHLEVSLTPATLRAVVGHRATMTGLVHNAGAGAAPGTVAVAITVDAKHPKKTHFRITNGAQLPSDPGEGGTGASGSASAGPVPLEAQQDGTTVLVTGGPQSGLRAQLQRQALARHAASARRHALPSVGFWPQGTIAPGATKRVPIKLRALTVGTDSLAFGAISETDDNDCFIAVQGGGDSGSSSSAASVTPLAAPQVASTTAAPAACSFVVQTHITAIAAPNDTAPLAESGPRGLDVQLGVAFWSLVIGGLLVWFGRRRVAGVTSRRHG